MTTATATQTRDPSRTPIRLDGTPVDLDAEAASQDANKRALVPLPEPALPDDAPPMPPTSRPGNLAAALALAQQRCGLASANSVSNRGAFADAEMVIATANAALQSTGLSTAPLGCKVLPKTDVSVKGKEWTLMEYGFRLLHESGQSQDSVFVVPVLFEEGTTIPNAFRAARTRALADYLRELLRMPKERKKVAADGGAEAKEKRAKEAEERRARAAAAQESGSAPAAQTTPAAAEPATTPPAAPPRPNGGIQIDTLNDLASLKAELFGLLGFGADTDRMRTEWRAILAKRGVVTANDLTDAQGKELAGKLREKVAKAREEIQKNGQTFP